MLVLAGLGLNFEEIPNYVIKNINKFDYVFLEEYTSIFPEEDLKKVLSLREDIKVVDRDFVENEFEEFLIKHRDKNIMLLVIGDPLFATTHFSIIETCVKNKIEYKVINSSSVLTKVGKTGLFLYKFGKIASIPFIESRVPYDILFDNLKIGAHTLFLLDLDIKAKRFMNLKEALEKMLNLEEKYKKGVFTKDTFIIVCERLGWRDEKIFYGKVADFLEVNREFKPPICVIVPGKLNKIEEEFLRLIGKDVRVFTRKI